MRKSPEKPLAAALLASLNLSPTEKPILLFLDPGRATDPTLALQQWVRRQLKAVKGRSRENCLPELKQRLEIALTEVVHSDTEP